LVDQVMTMGSYRDPAADVLVFDDGSSHRGERSIARLIATYPTIVPVHRMTSRRAEGGRHRADSGRDTQAQNWETAGMCCGA
jgi:hypothetical protein